MAESADSEPLIFTSVEILYDVTLSKDLKARENIEQSLQLMIIYTSKTILIRNCLTELAVADKQIAVRKKLLVHKFIACVNILILAFVELLNSSKKFITHSIKRQSIFSYNLKLFCTFCILYVLLTSMVCKNY